MNTTTNTCIGAAMHSCGEDENRIIGGKKEVMPHCKSMYTVAQKTVPMFGHFV